MRPLTGRCRACDAKVELRSIAANADGRCPVCSTPFSEEWTVLLVKECASLESLTHAIVRSLRRLAGLPGNLEIQPEELLANLSTEVPWGRSIDTEPAAVAGEVGRLAQRLDSDPDAPAVVYVEDARALAARLLGLATILEAHQEAVDPTRTGAGDAARYAARHLAEAADAIDEGDTNLTPLRSGLRDASEAT